MPKNFSFAQTKWDNGGPIESWEYWQPALARCFEQIMIRWKNYKYVAHLDDLDELYDLAADPYELRNAVDDPKHASALECIRGLAVEQMEEHEDRSPDAEKLKRQILK